MFNLTLNHSSSRFIADRYFRGASGRRRRMNVRDETEADDAVRAAEKRIFERSTLSRKKIYRLDFRAFIMDNDDDLVKTILRPLSIPAVMDDDGRTLLYLAAKYNNVYMTNYFVDKGCDIDAKTKTDNRTPLMTALNNDHYEAAEILIERRSTDFDYEDLVRTIQVLLERHEANKAISIMYLLRARAGDTERMARALVAARVPMKYIIPMHDAILTEIIINTGSYGITDDQAFEAIKMALKSEDIPNLKVLWQNSRHPARRRALNKYIFSKMRDSPSKWRIWVKTTFKYLTKWSVFDENLTEFLVMICAKLNKKAIEFLLVECNIDEQLFTKHKFQLLPCVFGNPSEELLELVQKKGFDVNASRSTKNMTALHFAASNKVCNNVKILFELGADVNAKDENGHTPIRHTHCQKCAELLLMYGANVQIEDNRGRTILENLDEYPSTWRALLAQLAVEHNKDEIIKEEILDKINSNSKYKSLYDQCLDHVRVTLNYNPLRRFPTVTMFTFIAVYFQDIPDCIRTPDDIAKVMKCCRDRPVYLHYQSTLKFGLEQVFKLYKSKVRAAKLISHKRDEVDYRHMVIDKIFRYLHYSDVAKIELA